MPAPDTDPHERHEVVVRLVFELLADHPGPDTTAAPLAAVLDLRTAVVTAALEKMAADGRVVRPPHSSPLAVGGHRYVLAEGISRHAAHRRGRVPPSLRTQQIERLLDWYVTTAAVAVSRIAPDVCKFSPDVRHAPIAHPGHGWNPLGWFAWEHSTLRTVLAALMGRRQHDSAVELAEAIWHCGRPGYRHDDVLYAQQAGRVAAERSTPAIAAVFRAREAIVLADLDRLDDARAAVADAARLAAASSDGSVREAVTAAEGRVHLAVGDADRAVRAFTLALAEHRRLPDRYGQAVLYRRVGQAYLAQRQIGRAISCLRQARSLMPPLSLAQVRTVTHLADALIRGGRAAEADTALREVHPLITGSSAVRYRVGHDLAVARAAYHLGDDGRARRRLDDLITQLTTLDNPVAARDLTAARELRRRLEPGDGGG